jgi:hypothetical protein
MKLDPKLGFIIFFGILLFFALTTLPLDSLASFNPVEWLADSINGFFDWIFNLLFGWLPW